MSTSSRSAAVAVSALVAVALVPGVAHAAEGTVSKLSAAQMAAALKAAAPAARAASADGWRESITATGTASVSILTVADVTHKVVRNYVKLGKLTMDEYRVDGQGTYSSLSDPLSRRAVVMMKRPEVRFLATPDRTVDVAGDLKNPDPVDMLTSDTRYAGTKTVHADGTTDYRFKPEAGLTATIHLGADGVVTGADSSETGATVKIRFGYGPQDVVLPARSTTIRQDELSRGIAYLEMADAVRTAATESAGVARRKANGRTVSVAALRKAARQAASDANLGLRPPMVGVTDVARGAKLTATNPWTHQTVTYTVKVDGKKVDVRKG